MTYSGQPAKQPNKNSSTSKKDLTKLILGLLCIYTITGVTAQGLGDLFGGKKKDNKSESSAPAVTVDVKFTDSQYERFDAFYNAYTGKISSYIHYNYSGADKFNKETTLARDEFFKDIKRDEKNRVISFSCPIDGSVRNFKIKSEPEFPRFYYSSDANGTMYMVGPYAIFHIYDAETDSAYVQNKSSFQKAYIITGDPNYVKGKTLADYKTMLASYLGEFSRGYMNHLNNKKALAEQAEKEKRAKFTTENKNVTSLKLNLDKTQAVQGDKINFEIIAVLKDGTEISTKNGGYQDEFIIELVGLPQTYFNIKSVLKETAQVLGAGSFYIPITESVKGDQVVMNVSSKFYPNVKVSKTIKMDYSAPFYKLDDLKGWSNRLTCDFHNPPHCRLEVKQVKNAITNDPLIEFKLIDKSNNKVLYNYKIKTDAQVSIDLTGAPGYTNGKCNGKDKSGGNGANVTVVIDPSVKNYNIDLLNEGGNGAGGLSLSGSKGTIEKLNQKVNW